MAVTAYSARGDEERIREAGAQAYVSKPISVVRFAQTVDELLEQSAAAVAEPVVAGERGERIGGRPRPGGSGRGGKFEASEGSRISPGFEALGRGLFDLRLP